MDKRKTLKGLLEEAKKEMCEVEIGQVYETMNSIYPDEHVLPFEKNIVVDDVRMTLPLACSSRAKKGFKKTGSSLNEMFKDGLKGDYLLVEKIVGEKVFCKNISITEDCYNRYYKVPNMRKIEINKNDIAKGNVKRVYRGFKNHLEEKK